MSSLDSVLSSRPEDTFSFVLRPPLPSPSGVPESSNWAKGYVNKLGLVHLADSCRLAGVQRPASKVKPNISKTTWGDMTYGPPEIRIHQGQVLVNMIFSAGFLIFHSSWHCGLLFSSCCKQKVHNPRVKIAEGCAGAATGTYALKLVKHLNNHESLVLVLFTCGLCLGAGGGLSKMKRVQKANTETKKTY